MRFLYMMILPFQRYVDFTTRSSRTEMWAYMILFILLYGTVKTYDRALFQDFKLLETCFIIITFLPSTGLFVRRLHDTGRSGWWFIFYTLVPTLIIFAGIFISLTSSDMTEIRKALENEDYSDIGISFIVSIFISAIISLYYYYLLFFRAGDYVANRWGLPYGQEAKIPEYVPQQQLRKAYIDNADKDTNPLY